MKNRGFTLIELLVVIAIIGLLATIVMVSLNSARVKARDTKRAAEIKQLALAIQMYYDNNGSFPPTAGCLNGWCCLGHGSSGRCWAGVYWGSDTVDSALSPTYVSKIPDDPLNNTAKYGDAYMYRVDTDTVMLHWGIETCSPTSAVCDGGTYANWGAGAGNGCNYYCIYPFK
ncbi:type II secretion system protein [Patescibacteria group bacterium]|nr:type II secretion system protein [Patescibacteria group bacterium]